MPEDNGSGNDSASMYAGGNLSKLGDFPLTLIIAREGIPKQIKRQSFEILVERGSINRENLESIIQNDALEFLHGVATKLLAQFNETVPEHPPHTS
ncbi:MAG TPA: hypothetical protein VLA04_06040 [Verrucomicrobiae bacterium]|nr:hypothetical protein [Verrucomicrobiae bacterium]